MPERSAWTLNPKITAEQTEACTISLEPPVLQLIAMNTQLHLLYHPIKINSPNFLLLVYLFIPIPFPLLESELKLYFLHFFLLENFSQPSLHFLLFVNSFTTYSTGHSNKKP